MRFKDTVVIVTGGSRGIGEAIALGFGAEGANVVVNYKSSSQKAEDVKDRIIASGGQAIIYQADITDTGQVEKMMADVNEQFGRIDILVNNAAIYKDSVVWKMETEAWDEVIQTDLCAVFHCTKYAIPFMKGQGNGRIISISSVVGQAGGFGVSNYAAAKAGIFGFTKAVAQEVAMYNITVNAVVYGFIETGMLLRLPDNIQEIILKQIPVKRWGKPKEAAAAVLFIASEDAGYITGQQINVNGGYYM